MKHKLTKSDLSKRLSDLGFKEGDTIDLPSDKAKTNETTSTSEGETDEEGDDGGNHPPKKGGN